MGRPSLLTEERKKIIVEAISNGAPFVAAADAGCIAYNTFNEWMKKGESAESGVYKEFYDAVKKAESSKMQQWIGVIARDESWQSKAWLLERRWPHLFSKRTLAAVDEEKPTQHVWNRPEAAEVKSDSLSDDKEQNDEK